MKFQIFMLSLALFHHVLYISQRLLKVEATEYLVVLENRTFENFDEIKASMIFILFVISFNHRS